jgi:hypothetical protein
VAFNSDEAARLTPQTRQQITNKLKQMLTANGVAGNINYSQFVLIPHFDVVDKHILAGPPAKVVMNINVTLEIKELVEGSSLSVFSAEVNGVGNNEAKAYAQGIKQLGNSSTEIKNFFDTARGKIVSYYDRNSAAIIN